MTQFEEIGEVRRGDDGIPRDRFGRYVLPDPETGKPRAFTRATTIAGTLKDRFGLEKWDQRNVVFGIGQRPALYAKAAAATLNDVKTLDSIVQRAKEAADSQAGSDIGSAVHTMAERIDRGEEFEPPAPYDSDLRAYRNALEAADITTCLGWIERVVCVPELYDPDAGVYGVCGQLDRLNASPAWSLPRIGDIKTATDKPDARDPSRLVNTILSYGMVDIPLQLAIYAHAAFWWDTEAEQWVEMPAVDQSRAIVMHIPAGMGECRIYEIDIEAGWKAVQLAMDTRRWRKRKDLAELIVSVGDGNSAEPTTIEGEAGASNQASGASAKGGEGLTPGPDDPPASPSPSTNRPSAATEDGASNRARIPLGKGGEGEGPKPEDPPAPQSSPLNRERWEWLRERVNVIKQHPGARKRLAALWSLKDEIPLFPNEKNPDRTGPRTDEELSVIVGLCDLVEMEFELPFGPPDPAPRAFERKTQSEKRRERTDRDAAARARAMARATKAKGAKQS